MSYNQDKESEAFNSTASMGSPYSTLNSKSANYYKKVFEVSSGGNKFLQNPKMQNFEKIQKFQKNQKLQKIEKSEKSTIQGIFVLKKDLQIQNLLSRKKAKNKNKDKFSFTFNKEKGKTGLGKLEPLESTNFNKNFQDNFPVLSLFDTVNGNINLKENINKESLKHLNHTLRIDNLNKSKTENEANMNKKDKKENLKTKFIKNQNFGKSNIYNIFPFAFQKNTIFSNTNSNSNSSLLNVVNSTIPNINKNYTKIKFPKLTLQPKSLSIYDMKQTGVFNPFNHTTMEKFSRIDLKSKIENEDGKKPYIGTKIENFNYKSDCNFSKTNSNFKPQVYLTGTGNPFTNSQDTTKGNTSYSRSTFVTNLNFQKIDEINNLIYESKMMKESQYNQFKKKKFYKTNLNNFGEEIEKMEKIKNKIHPILINNKTRAVSPPLSAHTYMNQTRDSYAQTQSQFHTITPLQNLKKVTLFSSVKSETGSQNISINNLKKNSNASMGNLYSSNSNISNAFGKRLNNSKRLQDQTLSKSSDKHFSKDGNSNPSENIVNHNSNYSKIKSKQYMQRNLNDDISFQLSKRDNSNNHKEN